MANTALALSLNSTLCLDWDFSMEKNEGTEIGNAHFLPFGFSLALFLRCSQMPHVLVLSQNTASVDSLAPSPAG